MTYRFTLDSVVVNEPGNDQVDISPELFRDETKRIINERIDQTLSWSEGGYSILRAAFERGFCERVTCLIEQRIVPNETYQILFEGFIYITDCSFNLETRVVDCKLTDNSFSAQIDVNRNIKFQINVPRTKNDNLLNLGVPLASEQIDFFLPAAGVGSYTLSNVETYLVINVLSFLSFSMSDNNIVVVAPIFEVGGDFEGLCICTGAAIRAVSGTGITTPPYLSFDELWLALWRQFDLYMTVDTIDKETARIVIQKATDLYQAGTVFEMSSVEKITETIETDRLFTKIKFGNSTHIDDDGTLYGWGDNRFFTHAEEEYHLLGLCNVETELDLVTDIITSSNVIQDIIENDSDTYDEDVFLIETNRPAQGRATKFDPFTGPDFVYNAGLANSAVAERWKGSIPNSAAFFSGVGNDNFRAELTSASTSFGAGKATPFQSVIDYNSIITDNNNNYNAAGDYYDVPIQGYYEFKMEQHLSREGASTESGDLHFQVQFERQNSAGGALDQKDVDFNIDTPTADIIASAGFFLNVNDRVRISFFAEDLGPGPGTQTFTIFAHSSGQPAYFETSAVVNEGGGIWQDYQNFNAIKKSFTRKLDRDQYNAIKDAPGQIVVVNGVNTYLRSIKWNSRQSMADFNLIEKEPEF